MKAIEHYDRCREAGECCCQRHAPVGYFRVRHRASGFTMEAWTCQPCLDLETAWDHQAIPPPNRANGPDQLMLL